MQGINKIYCNEIGISFYWKATSTVDKTKVQLIFRDIGFLLNLEELKAFSHFCQLSHRTNTCSDCKLGNDCRNLLLKTPSDKIDIAISANELEQVSDLLDATILKVELQSWISNSYN